MAKSKIRKYFLDPILGLDIVQWCFAIPVSLMMWLVFATCCTHIRNKKILKEYRKKPAVFVVWHGRSMVPTAVMALYRMRSCVVTSRHKDGRFMAKIQHMFGGRAIFGSSSSGGVSVLREGVRLLNKGGRCLVLSPDGPGGPSLRMQEGAMYFAKMTGAPIIPVCFSAHIPGRRYGYNGRSVQGYCHPCKKHPHRSGRIRRPSREGRDDTRDFRQ